MLPRITTTAVLLAAFTLASLACNDGQTVPARTSTPAPAVISAEASVPAQTQTSVPAQSSAPTPAPVYLNREILPCTPVSRTNVDPCEPDAPPFEMGGANSVPLLGDEPASIREMLDDDSPLPAWVTHFVLRGTYLPGTVRCTVGDRFRPPPYLLDEFVYTANSRSFKCYVDVRANAYVIGSGPPNLTVLAFRYAYFDGQYASLVGEGRTEQEVIEELRHQFETAINSYFPGREHVIFLGPSVDISSEAWRFMGYWDIQQTNGDAAIAVHPRRDLWASTRPVDYRTHLSTLEMPLPAFTQAVTAAHQARVAEYDGRIGADADLPDLLTNANDLREYYIDVGAYDHPDGPPTQPPPPCGLAVSNQSDNPGLMRDCINLLGLKDSLRGTGTLNWSVDTAISEWDGVRVEGSPGRVTRLTLGEKSLTGTIPPELARLDGLEYLWLSYNQLTGEIPAALGGLASLRSLVLNDNLLTGGIPTELGDLSSLEALWLNRNQLSGEIPSELGDLSNLDQLLLAGNRITGAMPTEIGDLSNLESLSLSGNRLTGTIPAELGRLSNLQRLELANNQFTGTIPTVLGGLTDLDELDLSSNQLSGTIPTALGDLAKLKQLSLSHNRLTGAIPAEIGSLAELVELRLSGNSLAGAIPVQLGSLSNLEEIRLGSNRLTGCIPPSLRSIENSDLDSLDLQNCPTP